MADPLRHPQAPFLRSLAMSRLGQAIAFVFRYLPGTAALGTIACIVYLAFVGKPPASESKAIIYLLSFSVVLLIASIVLSILNVRATVSATTSQEQLVSTKAELVRGEQRLVDVLSELNQILEIDYKYCTYMSEYGEEIDAKLLEIQFEQYLSDMLLHTAIMFGKYTNSACATCIKALVQSSEVEPSIQHTPKKGEKFDSVFTLARDPLSRVSRRRADRQGTVLYKYLYAKNTAFKQILRPRQFTSYFTMENLRGRPRSEYENANPDWGKHYDAVAVAALCEPGADSNAPHTLGFICVDNKTGGFDYQACRQLLECISSIAYYSIERTTELLESKKGSER